MLAAATSSRPAVTRRAYECGGADVDGDGIIETKSVAPRWRSPDKIRDQVIRCADFFGEAHADAQVRRCPATPLP
jgi:hypothetical protein